MFRKRQEIQIKTWFMQQPYYLETLLTGNPWIMVGWWGSYLGRSTLHSVPSVWWTDWWWGRTRINLERDGSASVHSIKRQRILQVNKTFFIYRKVVSSNKSHSEANWFLDHLQPFLVLPFFDQVQSYTYQVLQTIQMKLILLCDWAELTVLGSAKTAIKFIYKI